MDRLLSQGERGLLRMRVSWLSDERDVAVLTGCSTGPWWRSWVAS